MTITVKYQPNVAVLDEDCGLDESWVFNCLHTYTVLEDNEVTSFYGDADVSYNQKIEVCYECDEVVA